MKSTFLYSVFFACGLLFLLSCNSSSTTSAEGQDSIVIEHKLGKVLIYGTPQKLVVFDIGSMETLHELGVNPVGIPKQFTPDYLAALKDDPSIEDVGALLEPNFEKINALEPDLIVVSTRQEKFYDELVKIAPTVFINLDTKDYLPSFEANTRLLAKLVGKEELAEEKLQEVGAKIASAKKDLSAVEHTGLVALHNNGKFSVYGSGSRFGFLHDVLGVKPALNALEEAVHGQKVSNEFLLETNPDYIFIVDRNQAVKGVGASKEEIENKMIQETKAYKAGHIVYLDPQVWYLSGGGLTSTNMMVDEVLSALK